METGLIGLSMEEPGPVQYKEDARDTSKRRVRTIKHDGGNPDMLQQQEQQCSAPPALKVHTVVQVYANQAKGEDEFMGRTNYINCHSRAIVTAKHPWSM